MEKVRIGCVKYLNTLPLIQGLSAWKDAELIGAVPAKLIDMLLAEEIDIGLVSVIDAVRAAEPLSLLPVGMIGCDGPTLTVRLFSPVPLDEVRTIYADTDSHTSATLARVVLARRFGAAQPPALVDYDARERIALGPPAPGHDRAALLLIGDKVVTDAPPADRYPHQLDLGEAWKELTGLPFVYAVWMCRTRDLHTPAVRLAAQMLDRARRHNAARADWLVAHEAPGRGWPPDLAATYLGSYLRYEVSEPHRAAVARFVEEAAAFGLAPRRAVSWAEL